jgi:ATP-dependent helicase/nuclease subunit A
LTRFIDFIEKLLESGQDWAPAEPQSAAGNAVRVLSVHKSKGLEFPVVFIAETDNEFSRKDSRRDCLLDEQYTLGLQIIDPASNTRFDSLAYQVIEQQNRRRSLAEEMRILYVAMTRAIDRLILVGCAGKKKCQNSIGIASFFDDGPVPHVILDSSNSHLDWLLCALSRQTQLHQAFETNIQTEQNFDNLFSVQSYDQPELIKLSSAIQSSKLSTQHSKLKTHSGARDLSLLKEALNWRYPFGDAPKLPAKRSVTRLTHRNDEFTKADYSLSLGRRPKAVLLTQQLDGRSIGSAAHLVISLLPLDKPITNESVSHLIHKLVADEAITESVASRIDVGSIVNFFKTDLGQMALDKNNEIYREWPFTFTIPASQWLELEQKTQHSTLKTENSTIIVQGIIDLLIETPEGLIVIDFKTDDVSADAITKRAELYRAQLDLYAQAAQAVTGQKVLSKWLYFLSPSCAIQL